MPTRYRVEIELREPAPTKPTHLHALVCTWLEPAGAPILHAGSDKPFSVTPLLPCEGGLHAFEIGLLDDDLHDVLVERVGLAARAPVRLGAARALLRADALRIVQRSSWETLFRESVPARDFRFLFRSPTAFRSGREYVPFPLPTLVFGSYRHRWDMFAPAEFGIRLSFDGLGLVTAGHRLATATLPVKNGGRFVGFVGETAIKASGGDESDHRALATLASLAPFCGTGSGTAMGMGVTRLAA